ncbi:MAG: bestrophin family ion channel [Geitlerinemataceae cyanobacterium]
MMKKIYTERLSTKKYFYVLIFKRSIISKIFVKILICTLFALVVSVLHRLQYPVAWSVSSGVIPSIVLGLLLVFRTNTAYDRFWEGRKAWGTLVNTNRNLARQIWISIAEQTREDRAKKIEALKLLVAFAVSMKLHIRGQSLDRELEELLQPAKYIKLKTMNHPPLEIAFWIGNYLQEQHDRSFLNTYQLAAMTKLLDVMVDMLGVCERILKTPIPPAYSIHLRQLLFVYCLAIPFELVGELGDWTAIVVSLVSFTMFGVEEIGIEIENPFDCDPNDLPLDDICQTMKRNIDDLITLAPCRQNWRDINLCDPD